MQCHLKRIPYTTRRTDNHQLHTCSLEYGVVILLKDSEFRLFRVKHAFDINFIRQTGFIQTSNRFYLNAWPTCAWLPAIALVRYVGTNCYDILRIHTHITHRIFHNSRVRSIVSKTHCTLFMHQFYCHDTIMLIRCVETLICIIMPLLTHGTWKFSVTSD